MHTNVLVRIGVLARRRFRQGAALSLLCLLPLLANAQRLLSLAPADSLHRSRAWLAGTTGGVVYTASMVGLWKIWYADYPTGRFHFFNDNSEWLQMDKMGHAFSAYHEARLFHGVANWAGAGEQQAAWVGFGGGQLIQLSFEVFDGFSKEWGFSWGDVGFNTLGSTLFVGQQLAWREQRIVFKMSGLPPSYPDAVIQPYQGMGPGVTLQNRADELFGAGPANLLLKNYNATAFWLSANPRAFAGEGTTWLPRWLNVAVGMGADNLFAGTGYTWQADKNCVGTDCLAYRVEPTLAPRTRQWFVSLDVDLTRIRAKKRWVRTLLQVANVIKIPAPTVEWNSRGQVRWHALYF